MKDKYASQNILQNRRHHKGTGQHRTHQPATQGNKPDKEFNQYTREGTSIIHSSAASPRNDTTRTKQGGSSYNMPSTHKYISRAPKLKVRHGHLIGNASRQFPHRGGRRSTKNI